jgi:hypothetical protein
MYEQVENSAGFYVFTVVKIDIVVLWAVKPFSPVGGTVFRRNILPTSSE